MDAVVPAKPTSVDGALRAVMRERKYWIHSPRPLLSALLWLSAVAAAFVTWVGLSAGFGSTTLTVWIPVIVLAAISVWTSRLRWQSGRIAFASEGVWIETRGARRRCRLDEVPGAWVFDRAERWHVAIQLQRDALLIVMADDEHDAHELVSGVGIDAGERHVSSVRSAFDGMSVFLAALIGLAMFVAGAFRTESTAVLVLVLCVFSARILSDALTGGRRVEIGRDGVCLIGLGYRRLFLLHEIDRAAVSHDRVDVALRTRKRVRLYTGPSRARSAEALFGKARDLLHAAAEGRARALAGWIDAAVERARRRRFDDAATVNAFLRRGRSIEAWRRALSASGGPYRTGEISLETVRRVFDDPGAPAVARVGAAIAWADLDRHAARENIRIEAASSVQPELRAALTAVADVIAQDAAQDAAPDADVTLDRTVARLERLG